MGIHWQDYVTNVELEDQEKAGLPRIEAMLINWDFQDVQSHVLW